MIDEVNDFDFQKVIRMYMKEPKFSGAKILRICIKLYGMMENFAKISSNHLHFLHLKKARITRAYGNEVDLEDRIMPDESTMTLDPQGNS